MTQQEALAVVRQLCDAAALNKHDRDMVEEALEVLGTEAPTELRAAG